MERYTYEFEIYKGERYWVAAPLGMEGGTQGLSREDAIESAAEWLREEIDYAAAHGQELPAPAEGLPLQHGGERVSVVVDGHAAELYGGHAAERDERDGVEPNDDTLAAIEEGNAFLDSDKPGRFTNGADLIAAALGDDMADVAAEPDRELD